LRISVRSTEAFRFSTPVEPGSARNRGGRCWPLDLLADQQRALPAANGDTYFEVDLTALHEFHVRRQSDWTFSLFRSSEAGRYMGMGIDDEGHITALKSGTAEPGRLATAACTWSTPSVLRHPTLGGGREALARRRQVRSRSDRGRR